MCTVSGAGNKVYRLGKGFREARSITFQFTVSIYMCIGEPSPDEINCVAAR